MERDKPISSAELLKGTSCDLSKPFERGPFPPEMRMFPEGRRIECEHCKGMGWYETDQKLESGDGWNEPYHWEWAEADCEVCGGTGWAP